MIAIRNTISNNSKDNFILVGLGNKYNSFKEKNIIFYNLNIKNKFTLILNYLISILLVFILRPFILICMGGFNIIPFGVASFISRSKFFSVITGEPWYELSLMPKLIRKIFSFLLKITFKKSYIILSISESIGRKIQSDYNIDSKKILLFSYKISDIFNPNVPKDLKRLLNPDGPIVLTIARISPEKGLHYLIEASNMIVKKIPNILFIIIGGVSNKRYNSYLMKMIDNYDLGTYFKIVGRIPYSEIPKYMVAADVFVLPSISEGMSLVILEALNCGIPVVASRVGGIKDILVHEYNGLLIEPGDINGITESIIRLLFDEDLRKRISKASLIPLKKRKNNDFELLLNKFIYNYLFF